MNPKTPILASLAVLGLGSAQATTLLFEDTFDRPNSPNTDGSVTGISGTVGSTFAPDTVYTHPFVDPANDPGAGTAADGGAVRINSNTLELAVGAGTSNAYINHNFIDAAILTDGGMTVSIDVTGYTGTARQNGGGFAIGMSQAGADTAADAFSNSSPTMTGAYFPDPNGFTGAPVGPGIVSDFWIGVRGNSSLAWGSNTGTVQGIGQNGLPGKTGTIAVNFFFSDFNAGSTVNYQVYFDDVLQGGGAFQWSGTNQNFIGLDGRDGSFVGFDNFSISTVPEPGMALLGGLGLIGLLRRRR